MEEEILFRCSGLGALLVEGKKTSITEKQLATIEAYEAKKKLTKNQKDELERLIAKRDAPPELSDTAKRFIEKTWLLNKKGFYEELSNKFISKGLYSEADAIGLISDLDDEFYIKNTERVTKGNITGECDVIHYEGEKKIIKDTKSCWSPLTFMAATLTNIYEVQGRGYMHLYDADEFHLEYVLVDTPQHIVEGEIWKLRNKYNIIDIDDEEVKPLFDQLRRNLVFSNNPAYTKVERRKKFVITRDMDIENLILSKIDMAIEYYKTIKLNQI